MCTKAKSLFLWLSLSCFSKGLGEIYFFNPPILSIHESSIDIAANSALEITCVGKYQVYWKLPETRDETTSSSRMSINESVDASESTAKYKSQILLQEVQYTDTGSYKCYYYGTTNFNHKENVTSVYVFVNDPDNLFVENYNGIRFHKLVVLQQQRRGLIACLPTNSRTNVTLWKTDSGDEIIPLGPDITFDPTEGFHIFYPTLYFSGLFQCRATLGEKTQEINITMYCFPSTYHDPQPFIDTDGALFPMVNGTFTLKCYVNVEIGTQVFFFWNYPQKNSSRINETVPSVQKKETRGYRYQQITSNLIVKRAQPEDSGTYRCSVTDHSQKTGTTEENIFVYPQQQESYVNFTTDIDVKEPVAHQAGQDVRFVILVHAFPGLHEVELYWEKNGQLLRPDRHYNITTTSTSVILEIKQLSRTDAGVYTLFGKTSHVTNKISITLHVKDRPIVSLRDTSRLYILGENYTLQCRATAYPIPEVRWRWKPCTEIEDCKREPPDELMDVESYDWPIHNNEYIVWKTLGEYNTTVTSDLFLTANHSGHYQCYASNIMGKDDITIPFLVTDAKGGFEITASNRRPVDRDDHVTLVCKVNTINFTHVEWKWRPMPRTEDRELRNSSDISIYMKSTVYSYTSVVEFNPIRMNYSADYTCIAFYHGSNTTTSKHIAIDVQGIQKPVLNETNMVGEVIAAQPASLQELYCYATGVPFPEIIWMKNNELLDVSSMSGVELTENEQRLTIRRVVEDDAGIYKCIAENRGGVAEAQATLEVLLGNRKPAHNKISTIILIIVFVVVGIIFFVLIFFLVQRILRDKRQKKEADFMSQNCFERGYVDIFNPNLPLEDQIDLLPYKKQYEFPKERLKLGKTLGQGAFGRVVKAEAIGLIDGQASTTVAVKMLKETADNEQRRALVAELKILIHLGKHLNILNLLGAVTTNLSKGELLVIVEYCCHGNLRHYLLKHKESFVDQLDPMTGKFDTSRSAFAASRGVNINLNTVTYANIQGLSVENPTYSEHSLQYAELDHQINDSGTGTSVITGRTGNSTCDNYLRDTFCTGPTSSSSECSSSCCNEDKSGDHVVTTRDLMCFSFQCARGMDYLISRKLIHRDLAARNVLLAKHNVVKICDFGLAKDCYKYASYIKKSDGLLPIKWMAIESIRERVFTPKSDVWSFGVLLWEIFTLGGNPYPGTEINEEFFKKLKNGYRMEKPDFAPDNVYELMKDCWLDNPSQRPDFGILADKIGSFLEASVREYYIELNEPYQVMNEELINNNDYLKMNGSSVDYADMQKPAEVLQRSSSPQNVYDNITSIRPVGDGPVPSVPMEIVPMIQLESAPGSWSEEPNVQMDSLIEPSSEPDVRSSYVTGNGVLGYLKMNSTDDAAFYDTEENTCVFLKNVQAPEDSYCNNGDYTSVPLLQGKVHA